MSNVILLTSASGSPWAVPSDWNNAANTIELFGCGGTGGTGTNGGNPKGGGGGGGGGYAKYTNVVLTPSGTMAIQIGAGGSATDTFAINGTTMLAKHGNNGSGATGGTGGAATTGAGSPTTFAGGTGGAAGTANNNSATGGGGGGGAGNKNGNGAVGGATPSTNGAAAGGGGGTGGGTAGAAPSNPNGGAGGNRSGGGGSGAGGIAGGAAAQPGTGNNQGAGGGGGGDLNSNTGGAIGGQGGAGQEYTVTAGGTAGAGGGGGGGGGNSSAQNAGGTGGLYGGGGGGGNGDAYGSPGVGGVGASGAIVITYTPSVTATDFIISGGSTGVAPGGTTLNFTLAANGSVAGTTATFTLSDGGKGGTFTPTSPTIAVAGSSATFTYTASSSISIGTSVVIQAGCTGGGAMNGTVHSLGSAGQAPVLLIISGNFGGVGDSLTTGVNASAGTNQGAISVTNTDYLSWLLYQMQILPTGPYPIIGNGEGVPGATAGPSGINWFSSQYSTAKTAWLAQGTSTFTILLGSNDSRVDVGSTNAVFKAGVLNIITNLQADFPGCKILLLLPPWYSGAQWIANGGSAGVYSTTSVGALNGSLGSSMNYYAQLQSLANGTNVFCGSDAAFNYFQAVTAASGVSTLYGAQGQAFSDGIHPNNAGYEALGHFYFQDFRKAFFPDPVPKIGRVGMVGGMLG